MPQEIIFASVVNRGKAESLLTDIRAIGVTGGVVMLGEGTVTNKVLEFLGLDETQKEVIIIPVNTTLEPILHEMVEKNFEFDKKNTGIAFSIPMNRYQDYEIVGPKEEYIEDNFDHMLLVTIVDEGKSRDAVKAAKSAGAPGGTIIHGRGAGQPEESIFNLSVEPEKDIILILINKSEAEEIRQVLIDEMELEKPGNGILFALPVSRTTGVYKKEIRRGN